MAKLPPKQEAGNDQEWLNTYADMVTLLLTFFVLLFACSNMDETKVQYIFQAFQAKGRYVNTIVSRPDDSATEANGGTTETPDGKGGEGEMLQSFDELFQYLSEYVDDNQLGEMVSVEQGAASITIRFNDSVFFDGDSYRLKAEGKAMLDGFIPAFRGCNRLIENLIVTGHTANVPFPTMDPFMLSSMRAVSVQNYLNSEKAVDYEKYQCHGYGPNKPAYDNDTADGKRKNRRVEIVLLRSQDELDINDPAVFQDLLEHQYNIKNHKYDVLGPKPVDPTTLPEGSAEKIIAEINNDYNTVGISSGSHRPGTIELNEFKVTVEDSSTEK